MKSRNLDSGSQLYKVSYPEFTDPDNVIKLASDPDYDEEKFKELLETEGPTDHTKLVGLIKKINDMFIDFEDVLEENFDVRNLSYRMAFQISMGNHDTQSRNMFSYSPLSSQRWYVIPRDNDGSFFETEYQIQGPKGSTEWETDVNNYRGDMLFQRALKTKSFHEALDAIVEDLYDNYLTRDRIMSLSNELASVVKPYISEMPDSTYLGTSMASYQTILDALPSEIKGNYQKYYDNFKRPTPSSIGVSSKTSNNKMKLTQGNAYNLDSEDITYTVEVSENYDFLSTIYEKENLELTSTEMDLPDAGQYFICITATNVSGESQVVFGYYATSEDGKVFGVRSFFVNADGNISRDIYEEGQGSISS